MDNTEKPINDECAYSIDYKAAYHNGAYRNANNSNNIESVKTD